MSAGFSFEKETDVIPIINVSLVVVLVLMIISPFLDESENPVDLPEALAADVEDAANVEITCTLDGQLFLGDDPIDLVELRPTLREIFADNPHAIAVVKADKSILYGEVEKLLAEVEAADAPQIALATRRAVEEEEPRP